MPMPIEPSGTRPSSTLSPERRPAATLPRPTPTAIAACRKPMRESPSASTSLPKRMMPSCSSAPRNQK
jgi:hypothetical protein